VGREINVKHKPVDRLAMCLQSGAVYGFGPLRAGVQARCLVSPPFLGAQRLDGYGRVVITLRRSP
jgi:hypothetical protein